jgi:hypothetical protein
MDEAAASDYERERQRNIEENKRMLASLGLTAGGEGGVLLPTQTARSVKPKPARRSTLVPRPLLFLFFLNNNKLKYQFYQF